MDERRRRGASRTLLAGSERESQGPPIGPQLKIATIHSDGAVRIVAEGELDLASGPLVEQALLEAEQGSSPTIVLDIDGITFIDSTGLRVLFEAHARSSRNGNRLLITRGAPQARRLFSLARAENILPFTDA